MVDQMERVGGQEDIDDAPGQGRHDAVRGPDRRLDDRAGGEDRRRPPKIARVIYNRLFLGMPLQIDATLLYGQDASNVRSTELKAIDTPYNTYLHSGLPPTPIANPGRASIRAALNPAPNPSAGDPLCKGLAADTPCLYLYYVLVRRGRQPRLRRHRRAARRPTSPRRRAAGLLE